MIEERSIAVAVCDACGHKDYADEYGSFFGYDGYTLTLTQHADETHHKAYACRRTHIGKSAFAVLHQWQQQDGPLASPTVSGVAADAPPLPSEDTTDTDTEETRP